MSGAALKEYQYSAPEGENYEPDQHRHIIQIGCGRERLYPGYWKSLISVITTTLIRIMTAGWINEGGYKAKTGYYFDLLQADD